MLLISFAGGLYVAYKQTAHFLFNKYNVDPEIEVVVVKPGTKAAEVADSIPGDKIRVGR
jgi:hypothetical protein